MIKVPLLRHQRYIRPSPLTLPLQNQRQNVPEKKMSTLTPLIVDIGSVDLFQVHYCTVSFSPAPGSEECLLFFMTMTIG